MKDIDLIQEKLRTGSRRAADRIRDALEELEVFGDDKGVAQFRGQLALCLMLAEGLKRQYLPPIRDRCEDEIRVLEGNLPHRNAQATVLVPVHADSLRILLRAIAEGGG